MVNNGRAKALLPNNELFVSRWRSFDFAYCYDLAMVERKAFKMNPLQLILKTFKKITIHSPDSDRTYVWEDGQARRVKS